MDPIFFNHRTGKPLTRSANRRLLAHQVRAAAHAGYRDALNGFTRTSCPYAHDPFRQAWLRAFNQAVGAVLHA